MSSSPKYILCLLLMLLPVVCLPAERPVIPAVEAKEPPKIDGDLSDACWKDAPSVSDFYFVNDSTPSKEPTTAWICYDQENIYIAFRCKESQPDKIVARQTKRGGSVSTDDWVGLNLDCYNNCDKIVWFDASSGGGQIENLQSGNVSKIEWKGDWAAVPRRLDDGYAVEISIPFSILQYDAEQKAMGIAFIRRHARCDEWWWSPNVGHEVDSRKFYQWTGLRLPRTGAKPLILGYSLLGAGDGDSLRRFGLDAKKAITPGVIGTLTLNPDFRNVEQQVNSIDFTYSERWLPDDRPFFQEGRRFLPGSDVFYSRTVEQIDYGGKLSGNFKGYNMGLMHGGRFDRDNFSAWRFGRSWPGEGGIDFAGAYTHTADYDGLVSRVSADYALYDRNDRKVYANATYGTADPVSGVGTGERYSAGISAWGGPRTLRWNASFGFMDSDYDSPTAYIPENNYRAWSCGMGYGDELPKGHLKNWDARIGFYNSDHLDGTPFYDSLSLGTSASWRDGTWGYAGYWLSNRPPNHDRQVSMSYGWGGLDLYKQGSISLSLGRQSGGDYLYYSIGQGWNFSDKLSTSISYARSRLTEPSPDAYSAEQIIASVNYDIDDVRSLSGRLVHSNGKQNLFLAYRRRVRAGLDLYMLFGDPNAESTRASFTLKAVSPFTLW